jgi:zinc transport system substrate-binding protein
MLGAGQRPAAGPGPAGRTSPAAVAASVAILLLVTVAGTALSVSAAAASAAEPDTGSSPDLSADDTDSRETIGVFVSIPPQAFFVRRIAGDAAQVGILVAKGQSPHTFDITPRQLAELHDADVYFSIGLPFEQRLVEKLSAADTRLLIVDTSWNVPRISVDGDESSGLPDPHTWLDPLRAKIQAKNICDALVRVSPVRANTFRRNLATLERDLDALDVDLRHDLSSLRGRRLHVFHPAFGYFASAYGLTQVSVETGETEPGPRDVAAFVADARREGARVVFVEPQYSPRMARMIAEETGAQLVWADPLAEDYIANLRSIGEAVRAALDGTDASGGRAGGAEPSGDHEETGQ